jgi:hypothetical protein
MPSLFAAIKRSKQKLITVLFLFVGLGAVILAISIDKRQALLEITTPSTGASASTSPGGATGKVAAVVNGKAIYDTDLADALNQGIDRAVAVDRFINKAVAAELATSSFPKESKEALQSAEREILSQLFVAKKTAEFRAAVTEPEIKTFYDANVKDEDYAAYKVTFLLAADEKEASTVTAAIAAGPTKELSARFKPVKEGADNFVLASDLPYGLGGMVKTLKVGEYSRAVVLRNGWFILHLEDSKANPKPDLKTVSDEIKNVLVAKKLTDTLGSARAAAKVELR